MENLTQKTETKSEVATAKENLDGILDAVKFAYDATDNDATKDVLLAVTKCVITAIQTNYRGLTLAELREAITRGAAGLYGLVFKLNASVIVSWIENYWQATAETRVAAARQNRKAITAKATITEKEKTDNAKRLLQSLYDRFCHKLQDGLTPCYAIVFDYLWRENEYRPTLEHCREVMQNVDTTPDKNLSIYAQMVGVGDTETARKNKAKKILVFEYFRNKQSKEKQSQKK